jgi:hypothetical protein
MAALSELMLTAQQFFDLSHHRLRRQSLLGTRMHPAFRNRRELADTLLYLRGYRMPVMTIQAPRFRTGTPVVRQYELYLSGLRARFGICPSGKPYTCV